MVNLGLIKSFERFIGVCTRSVHDSLPHLSPSRLSFEILELRARHPRAKVRSKVVHALLEMDGLEDEERNVLVRDLLISKVSHFNTRLAPQETNRPPLRST